MKKDFIWSKSMKDLIILGSRSPMTAALYDLLLDADRRTTAAGRPSVEIRELLQHSMVVAATDPWATIEYQSLYLDDMGEDRIVLQTPTSKDPMVGVMVLKAARLQGRSGMVYCGTPEQLKSFADKLARYEEISVEKDLNEKELLTCLVDAAQADGLKVIFNRLSPEHGGDGQDD